MAYQGIKNNCTLKRPKKSEKFVAARIDVDHCHGVKADHRDDSIGK